MVVMAAMMICLGASAIDKVVKKATLTGEVTSMEDLKASTFLLANGEGAETVVLYIPDGWDFKVGKPSVLSGSTGQGAYYKLEALGDNYQVPVFNIDKNARTGWWGSAYLNSQPKGGGVIFGLSGTNDQKGQDGPNLAVWTITYEEAKGFAFKCVGRDDADIYVGHDGTAARPVTEITYWKAYTGFESAYDAAEVEAAAKGVEAALKTSDAKTAYDDAKAAYEADKDLDKYVAAINAAVDVINVCEKVNKQYADYKLSTNGAAAVKGVVDKYNAGEYKDAAALNAAYVEAVKAQNCDGADMTGAIYNPSFELGNIDGWTSENCGNVANNYNFGGRTGDKFCERWQGSGGLSNGKFYQALTGLPNGVYKVTADLQNREQGNGDAAGTGFFVFANDDRTEGLEANNGKTIEVTTSVSDGNLTLGVQLDGCSGNWICFDNFTLTLVTAANAVVPEKDAWYTGADFFRFRADKNAAADSPYAAFKDKVEPAWGAAAGEETNGCIVCKVPANVNPASQIWIRGTEAGQTIANGSKDGFKVTFRVKADGEYKGLESQAHNGWGYKTGGSPFGTLDVTTEWQTVSFVCTGEKAKADFTDLCFNLSGDTERTFYFDDVQISRGSEWYLNCAEIHAKDYQDPTATYADSDNPHPFARFVSDAEGGYVEVITNANRSNPWDSQIWIGIPEQYVGKTTKMTMKVWADKAVKCSESYHATATGKGWGASASPGSGLETTVGEWVEITRILNTSGVNCNGVYKNMQVDYYCLDLSNDEQGSGTGITYRFKDIKFDKAQQSWYTSGKIIAKDYVNGDETYTNSDDVEFPLARYVYADDGDYVEVQSNANRVDEWDSQIWIEIPEAWVGKKVKMTMDVQASKEVTAAAAYHSFAGGNHWGPGAGEGIPFKVGEWTSIERVLNTKEVTCNKGEQVKYYVLNLSNDEKGEGTGITYKFKNIAWSEAPVDAWADLIPLQDFEAGYTGADDEKLYFFEKEQEISSEAYRARIVEGKGKDGGNAIEFRYAENAEQGWYSQFEIRLPYLLPNGTKIRLTADIKAEKAASGMGGQVWYNDFGSYRGGIPGYALEADTWYTYDKEITINDGEANDDPKGLRFLVFDGKGGSEANVLYFDNISVQIPEDQVPEGEPDFLNAADFPIFVYVDPSTLDWTDNLFTNGDVEGEDMSAFIAKVNSDADALLLPAASQTFKGSNQVVVTTAAREADPEKEGSYLGNDHDTQFFVHLPYALAKGTKYYFSVDVISNKVVDVQSQTHAEPGQWKSNTGVGKISVSSDVKTVADYFVADNDMRTIAFNLASATEGGKFFFDNFVFKVVKDDEAAIKEFTATWDGTSTWNETFALNQAVDAGRTTETEGQGYTDESVQALNDAIAAGKAELANAEATKETLAAAAKAIEDAIAGLEKGGVIEDCDLTADMFFTWDAVDATASKTGQAGCAYDIEKSTGMPYGDGTVNEYNYADLTAYDHLAITATEGEPRLLFNRAAQDDHQGPLSVELPRDFGQNKFEAIVDNGDGSKTYVINLKAITEKDGYAHLHAIKGANWANTTVTAMKLFVGASEYSDVLTNINGVEDGASVKDGKYFINGQIVIVKNGVKYNAAGVAIE